MHAAFEHFSHQEYFEGYRTRLKRLCDMRYTGPGEKCAGAIALRIAHYHIHA